MSTGTSYGVHGYIGLKQNLDILNVVIPRPPTKVHIQDMVLPGPLIITTKVRKNSLTILFSFKTVFTKRWKRDLKGHGNEADFLGFCRNWFLIDPLNYLSSRSAFGFEFAEIFLIEKQLPDSATLRIGESGSR
jgi:hypothetical protein